MRIKTLLQGTQKLLLLSSVFFLSNLCLAEIYQWQDEQGRTHYGDSLPEKNVKNSSVHKENPNPVIIQGSKADSERKRKQAANWYKKRQQQSAVENAQQARNKQEQKRTRKARKIKCERYKKRLSDTKDQLKAHKRAGVRARVENGIKIRIEQYKRDVVYYCL
ncbi:MAG: DUF4124 domain-containing protein [Pseudomonadales bacterium]|nr:DUF4124 domain-containing protein [Pseudomonadales bacterium]